MNSRYCFLLVFLALWSFKSFSQVSFGPKIGLVYNFGGDYDDMVYHQSYGFYIGGSTKIQIPSSWSVFVQPEILYHNKTQTIELGNLNKIEMLEQKLSVPILFGVRIADSIPGNGVFFKTKKTTGIDLYAGFGGDFFLNPTATYKTGDNNDKNIDLGHEKFKMIGIVGIGFENKKIVIDLRYQFGFSRLNNTFTIEGQTSDLKRSYSFFMAGIGYII